MAKKTKSSSSKKSTVKRSTAKSSNSTKSGTKKSATQQKSPSKTSVKSSKNKTAPNVTVAPKVIATKMPTKKSPMKKTAKILQLQIPPAAQESTPTAPISNLATNVQPSPAPETVTPTAPTRLPTRKLVGADRSISIVPQKVVALAPQNDSDLKNASANVSMPIEPLVATALPTSTRPPAMSFVPPTSFVSPTSFVPPMSIVPPLNAKSTEVSSAPAKPHAWTDLPKYIPAQLRFTMGAAKRESESAAASPFPFAKYISGISEICGLEFVLVLMSLTNSTEEISRQCGLSLEQIDSLLNSAGSNITEKFARTCPDMDRKWRARVTGSTTSVEALIEHHIEAKVDRNFQAMLAAVTLAALGVKVPPFIAPLATPPSRQ